MTDVLDDAVVFTEDPFTKAAIDDPLPIQARMRDAGPVLWLEAHQCYAVARHAEVHAVTNDWETFSSASGTGFANYSKNKPWRAPGLLLEADPPAHSRVRSIFNNALSGARVRRLREALDLEAERLVDRALDLGEIDGIGDLAQAYTLKVFPDSVGLPPDDREKFLQYGDMQLHSFFVPSWLDHDPYEKLVEADAWLQANCRRDAITGDGFGSAIYSSVDAGELTEPEAHNLVRSFLSAGVDNSITSFGNALWCYATYPDQWTKLRENPSLLRNSYEELLRFMGPLQFNFRTTTREGDLRGTRLSANEKVCVFIASANRDPRHWSQPEKFDIERRAAGHMAFGVGIHGCVGQVLARLEAEAFFGALLRKVRAFEIIGEPKRRYISVIQSFAHLPLRIIPL